MKRNVFRVNLFTDWLTVQSSLAIGRKVQTFYRQLIFELTLVYIAPVCVCDSSSVLIRARNSLWSYTVVDEMRGCFQPRDELVWSGLKGWPGIWYSLPPRQSPVDETGYFVMRTLSSSTGQWVVLPTRSSN